MDLFVNGWIGFLIWIGTAIVIVVVGCIPLNILSSKGKWPYDDSYNDPVWPLVIIALIAIIMAFVAAFSYAGAITEKTEKIDEQYYCDIAMEQELVSVYTAQQFRGEGNTNQFLGIGSGTFILESFDVYRYYYYTSDTFWRESVPAKECGFRYISKDETPRIVRYHEYRIDTYLYTPTEETKNTKPLDEKYYYIFYVPKGSIAQAFNIN